MEIFRSKVRIVSGHLSWLSKISRKRTVVAPEQIPSVRDSLAEEDFIVCDDEPTRQAIRIGLVLLSHGNPVLSHLAETLKKQERLRIEVIDDFDALTEKLGIEGFEGGAVTRPLHTAAGTIYQMFLHRYAISNFGDIVVELLKQLNSIERAESKMVHANHHLEAVAIMEQSAMAGEILSRMLREDAAMCSAFDSRILLAAARQIDRAVRRDREEIIEHAA